MDEPVEVAVGAEEAERKASFNGRCPEGGQVEAGLNNEFGSVPGGQVGGEETAKRTLCRGDGVAAVDACAQWPLSCGVGRCWGIW